MRAWPDVPALRNLSWCATRRDLGGGRWVAHFLLSVKDHPFAVCAQAFLASTIVSESSRAPLISPLQGLATRLFSCSLPSQHLQPAHNARRYEYALFPGLALSGRGYAGFHAGVNFAYTEF